MKNNVGRPAAEDKRINRATLKANEREWTNIKNNFKNSGAKSLNDYLVKKALEE